MSDVNDILTLIAETKQDASYDVYIPSLGESFKFLPLNANDQKELVKALVDSPFYSNAFNVKFSEILPSIMPPELDLTKITTFDKALISLKVRQENISDDYTAKIADKKKKEETFEKVISLSSHLEKVGEIEHPTSQVVKSDGYEVTLSVPSIQTDLEFERYLTSVAVKLDPSNTQELKSMISLFYITNITRYIETLKVKDTEFNFRQLEFQDKLKIGNSLLSNITREIVKSIDSYFGAETQKILEYKFTKDKEDYTNSIVIDNTFFMV